MKSSESSIVVHLVPDRADRCRYQTTKKVIPFSISIAVSPLVMSTARIAVPSLRSFRSGGITVAAAGGLMLPEQKLLALCGIMRDSILTSLTKLGNPHHGELRDSVRLLRGVCYPSGHSKCRCASGVTTFEHWHRQFRLRKQETPIFRLLARFYASPSPSTEKPTEIRRYLKVILLFIRHDVCCALLMIGMRESCGILHGNLIVYVAVWIR